MPRTTTNPHSKLIQQRAIMKILQVLAALSLLIGGCSGNAATAPPTSSLPPSLTKASPSQSAPSRPSSPSRAPVAANAALLLGNPSQAGRDANNYLVARPAHVMSYHKANGGPNWVAWHLAKSDIGPARRSSFRPDPLLPADRQIRPTDYTRSGYDRGHVCPSGDRTRDSEYNGQTFVMSNMLPQAPALNK